ncbi:hypothetical protein H0H92_009016 [Tricholoma furcatifolium]|nr:hypothetical protein H0H92_009016 [Tricholoma furcatifolium]
MELIHPDEAESSDAYELIEEGPASKVSRTWDAIEPHQAQWVIVKSAPTSRKSSKEPHDIVKELRILEDLAHPNIIEVWAYEEDTEWAQLHLWEPYIPISLSDVLASPKFSPFLPPSHDSELADESARELAVEAQRRRFNLLSRSIIFQTLQALVYLHSPANRIAHRDIKPRNLLLTESGCVKLIDFGIAWKEKEEDADEMEEAEYLWPERRPRMYFEVSTGPYRAPELLFSTRDYDAFAVDLWSAGATFAEFFTPLRLAFTDDDGDDDFSDEEDDGEGDKPSTEPFIQPKRLLGHLRDGDVRWERDSLFNGTRGELGLAWSIFKVRGTPVPDTWPAFDHLPAAKGVQFTIVPPVNLSSLLPNLPPPTSDVQGDSTKPATDVTPSNKDLSNSPLDLIEQLLMYPVEKRIAAARAVRHPWFSGENKVLLPVEYPHDQLEDGNGVRRFDDAEGKSLGQLIGEILG